MKLLLMLLLSINLLSMEIIIDRDLSKNRTEYIKYEMLKHKRQITHNGITYKTVKSYYTGKIWLDRNIGADRVCQSFNDTLCYGDLIQWGANLGSSFITVTEANEYDWARNTDPRGSKRKVSWSKTDASSVCPRGFRVPTKQELEKETTKGGGVENSDDAYNSFLKFPSAGYRGVVDGSLSNQGSGSYVWSSSVGGAYSHYLYFGSSLADMSSSSRADGFSVRCLKD